MTSGGEWYRLLTAPLLHFDLSHILFNCIALLIAGFLLERLVGHAWFLALFVIGALGGSLMSLFVNPPTLTSVGASGAIMCTFAALYVCSFRLPAGTGRSRVQARSIGVLIPSLLPLAASTATIQIDYGAHIGGELTGAAAGFWLLKTWPDTSRLPGMRGLARAIAMTGVVLSVAGVAAVAGHYSQYKLLFMLIPADQLPKTDHDIKVHGADLLARYPQDPRSHMYRAVTMDEAHDLQGAERELQIATPGGRPAAVQSSIQ